MNEQKILSALIKSRKTWEAVKEHIDPKDLGSDTNRILGYVNEYYNADSSAGFADIDILCGRVAREIPNEKHSRMLQEVLRALPDVSSVNVGKELCALKAHSLGLHIASDLSQGRQGREVRKLIEQYLTVSEAEGLDSEADEDITESWEVKDLVTENYNRENLIQIWPTPLNERLDGGARPGHHLLVFAPTEMGKTLIILNMVSGFTAQGLRTLYVGNEDPVADLQMRFITNLVGRPKQDIIKWPDRAQQIVDQKGYKNVIFAPLAPGTFAKIRRLVDKFKPNVVVLDQLRNLDVDSENRTQALEKAATEARNLAKSCQVLVVSVTQAGDSASGKRVLGRGDVDGSNVGIPGQADVMIGIGATEEDEKHNRRWLSFPKNKLSGNHDPLEITIDPITSRVVELAA